MNNSENQKSYRVHFFLLSLLLALSFIWSIYDESITRRPWKGYQEEFFHLEGKKLQQELDEINKNLDTSEINKMRSKLEKLTLQFYVKEKSQEYRDEIKELDEKNTRFSEEFQKLQFAKSLVEESYYQYQHAFDTGKNYEPQKEKWEKLYDIAKKMESDVDRAKAERDEIRIKVKNYKKEIAEIEDKLEIYEKDKREIENKINMLSLKSPQINQIVIQDFDKNNFDEPVLKVDRCLSCHMASDRKGFEDFKEPFKSHVNFDVFINKHPVEKFGCTVCHNGQGNGLTFYDAGHTPPNEDTGKRWEKKYNWKPIAYWEKPMLAGDYIQSSCRECHFLEEDIPLAPVLSEGVTLFRERLGCANCHFIKGYENVNKIGPELKNAGSKVNPSWLFQWIKNPKWHHKKTRMPNFKLSDEEAISITSYLMNLKGDKSWDVYRLKKGVIGNKRLIAKGKELVTNIGCNGCHSIGKIEVYKDETRDAAPILTNIGNKATPEWILNWILNPAGYSPKTLMPNFKLSPKEAESIVAYLYSLRDPGFREMDGLKEKISDKAESDKGLKIISYYGCYGCHNIPGTEKLGQVGAELSNFGNKELYELAFGYASDVERSWFGYTQAKIKTPRIFETEMIKPKMPFFGLSDDETQALTILLKSFTEDKIPKKFTRGISSDYANIQNGRIIIKKYNCIGCHEIEDGWGGENILIPLNNKYDGSEVKNYSAPSLIDEGKKVQSEWLFKYMHSPYSIRPWLKMKMPVFNFNDEQVNAIVKYFQFISGEDVFYHFWKQRDYTGKEVKRMKALFNAFQCRKCHQFAKGRKNVSPAELAPDLSLTKERLKPKWLEEWLANPQSLQKNTKMPNFFFDIDEEDGEIIELLPDPKENIELLKDYLFIMQ